METRVVANMSQVGFHIRSEKRLIETAFQLLIPYKPSRCKIRRCISDCLSAEISHLAAVFKVLWIAPPSSRVHDQQALNQNPLFDVAAVARPQKNLRLATVATEFCNEHLTSTQSNDGPRSKLSPV
jgi:hypothetical protein